MGAAPIVLLNRSAKLNKIESSKLSNEADAVICAPFPYSQSIGPHRIKFP